jgi:SAM-dependent methyltransferase
MTKPYRWVAECYDEVFGASRAPMDAVRERLLGGILKRAESVCDLACGTGETALWFARRGLRTFAVDLSPGMVRITRRKVRAAGLPVRVIQADMRDFRLPGPVDLITCEYDAVNHVPDREDLAAVARCVARALRPGGHFCFDVNNSLGFRRYWNGPFWIETRNVCMVMRSGHNEAGDRAWSDVETFIREGRHWVRGHDRVEEVCWGGAEIRATLREAGFDRVRAWDGAICFPGNTAITRGCRTIYLAKRSNSD